MKKLITVSAATLALTGLTSSAMAQEKGDTKITLWYNYSMPFGDLKNKYVDQASPRGAALDFMHYLSPKTAVGAAIVYQDFYQKLPRATYPQNDGSVVSAVVSNALQTIPVMAKIQYFPTADPELKQKVLPYVSLAAGANIVNYQQLFGEFNNGSNLNVRFAAQAGAGVRIPVGKERQNGIMLGSTFHYMPYNGFGLRSLHNLNFQAGFQFRLRDDGGGGPSNRWGPGDDRYRYRPPMRNWWW